MTEFFFSSKTQNFFFQNNPKNLDPSFKTDLDLWNCLGRLKLVLQQNFKGLIYSPTCIKQALKGQSKSACLIQVLV